MHAFGAATSSQDYLVHRWVIGSWFSLFNCPELASGCISGYCGAFDSMVPCPIVFMDQVLKAIDYTLAHLIRILHSYLVAVWPFGWSNDFPFA
jgi:hypothetical protein